MLPQNIPYFLENCDVSQNLLLPVADIKEYLKIEHDTEDELLNRLAQTVISSCEKYLGKSLSNHQYLAKYHCLHRNFQLLYLPIQQIDEVILTERESTRLDTNNYCLSSDQSYLTCLYPTNPEMVLSIRYTSGLSTSVNLADDLKQGLLMHLATIYENREGYVNIPKAALSLYRPYKNIRL